MVLDLDKSAHLVLADLVSEGSGLHFWCFGIFVGAVFGDGFLLESIPLLMRVSSRNFLCEGDLIDCDRPDLRGVV